MPHPRQVLREAVRAALINATAAGATVYETRVAPHRVQELPALAVYTLEESVSADSASVSPRELRRELSLVIEGWVAAEGATNVDDDMDALSLEVETAMHADPFFGGVASESLLDTTTLEVIEEGDRQMGWIVMTYAFTYFTDDPPAPGDLDDFETASATHNLANEVHEDNQAEDVFDVQESP